ncbi:regulator of G-protein signaling 5-like [Sebastes umbrosus]|uniref:regulator of G-protein signaling 5-like n=1 Tax=Sebastes umbrosus TaxID=72105 RepID=UPI00189C8AAE|nr:regulator of G-protein signaling 5-like [Sebastes umbrosus]
MCRGHETLPATCIQRPKDIIHKISFLLQKHEPQAADQKPIKEKTDAATTAAKSIPTPAEVKKWKESFSYVMSSQMGRMAFGKFLMSEFSVENMDFWVACENYKKSSPSKLSTTAKKLYQQHVKADAPNEVNLDAATREETRQNLENVCPSCFNDAQKMIYTLMEKDSYRRFLKSKLIQDLCQTQTIAKGKKNCNSAENRQATPKQKANI